ncbi:hypothetical protein CMI43_00215 [Candidatus Pacearchaeota archaeon]|nr:hypothetical protein [Candidatus Pacearchaeota archaeon]|tara:strand:+ start:484 stop:948 length:465 start_codon:yes stop_codon:yes gene_type:complete
MEKEDVMKKYFSSGSSTPLFPFDFIDSKITLLLKSIKVINKHPGDVVPPERLEESKRIELEAGSFLTFYVVQEISDFYRLAHIKFKDKIELPKSAKVIKDFRGSTIAHIKLDKASDIGEECIDIEMHGYDNILKEYEDFKKSLYKKIKDKELKL